MSDAKTSIRLFLDDELLRGEVVDIDRAADNLAEEFPDLSREQLCQLILEVVAHAGGNASWGDKR